MCLKAQCAFRVAPNSCRYSNAWSTMDMLVRNIEILIEIHRHRSVNTGCPQRIDSLQFNDLFRTKSLSMLT